MAFPWGYVERASGTDRNSSGLVAFVCVRDDPAVLRAQATRAALAAAVPGGADPDTALYAAPVAVALAGAVNGVPANLALAAVRAVIAVMTGVGGGVAGIRAAINGGGPLGGAAALPGPLPVGHANHTAQAAIDVVAVGDGDDDNEDRAAAAATRFNTFSADVVHRVAYPVDLAGLPSLQVTTSAAGSRARAGATEVDDVVEELNMPPADTELYAKLVAAALAGPAGWATAGDAATAAVRAVVSVLNGTVGTMNVAAEITGGGDLGVDAPVLGTALIPALVTATANAAIDVHNVGNAATLAARSQRAEAVADAFAAVPILGNHAVEQNVVQTAVEPAHFPLIPGRPPFSAGERFVLLNGDANFDYVPSLRPVDGRAVPVVVGLTAMHHGSAMETNGEFLDGRWIPWAPGSGAAAVPAVMAGVPGSAARAITATANNLTGVVTANLYTHVCHAGAAAAAAVYATNYGFVQANNNAERNRLIGNDYNNLAMGTASAVLSTLRPAVEAAEVGVAAILGTKTRIGTASAHEYADAARAARVRLRAGALPFAAVDPIVVEAIVKSIEPGAAGPLGQVAGQVAALAPAPLNAALFARPVAADLGVRLGAGVLGAGVAANVARAAVRAVVAVIRGVAGADAVANAINGGPAIAGLAVAPLVAPLTPARALSTANAAIAVVRAGQAVVLRANAALAQVAGAVPLNAPNHTELCARHVAVSLACSVAAPPNAADTARAAVRASIAALDPDDFGLDAVRADLRPVQIALMINGGGGPAGGAANLGLGMAVLGANLTAAQAEATADSAIETVGRGFAAGVEAARQRALFAARAFSAARCKSIETAVALVQTSLAGENVSHPMESFSAFPAAPLTNANVETRTTHACSHTVLAYDNAVIPREYTLAISKLARAAHAAASVAVVAAAPPVPNAEINAALPGLGIVPVAADLLALRAAVSAIMSRRVADPWPAAVDIHFAALEAAMNAMVGEAQRRSGASARKITAAIRAIEHGTTGAAAAAAAIGPGPSPGRIAYSYGVLTGNDHCYPATTLGNLGHPHPMALEEYEAHGWTTRRNTSLVAAHGGAQGDPNVAHLNGDISLSWDAVNDQNNATGGVNIGACLVCGQWALNR
jgi:hypothetical protein